MTTIATSAAIIKACLDRPLPAELIFKASRAAVAENPDNAPTLPRGARLPGAAIDAPLALAALTGKLWKPGRTLRVRFLDGDTAVQKRIEPFAQEWTKYANVTLVFDNDPNAEIRISFRQAGSWSYLGTDALTIPKAQPTMNFGWLTAATANDEYSRVVIHEFGHALGCIHEHQNPSTDIPWNKAAVYEYYGGPPNNWTKEQVDTNLFTRYSADITQFSAFDRESIMLYPIPNEFTEGDFEVGWNRVLSATDKSYIATLYPGVVKPEHELTIDAEPREATIGAFGEIDKYTFVVTTAGRYRMETEGDLDLVMSLFGPNDETRFLDQDDDSGRRLNARLISTLQPGVYTLKVRHHSGRRMGVYKIGVYRAT
jgi:hypothetical protein